MKIRHIIIANILFSSLFMAAAQAEDGQQGQRDGRRGPPQVALDACVAKVAGDACTFNGRNNEELTGTCFEPGERELACRPEGHDRRQGGQRGQNPEDSQG